MKKDKEKTPQTGDDQIKVNELILTPEIIDKLESIQSYLGHFYRRAIRETCDLIITRLEWIGIKEKEAMRLLKTLSALREDLEMIETPAHHVVLAADPFDGRLADAEAAEEFEDDSEVIAAMELKEAAETDDGDDDDSEMQYAGK